LRVTHTLISLGRLADRNLISEQERSDLSEAYTFLRTLEHRLQMEHGLQTHTLPHPEPQRSLIAKRMGFPAATAVADFEIALGLHITNVRKAYDRVFADVVIDSDVTRKRNDVTRSAYLDDSVAAGATGWQEAADESRVMNAARVFSSHLLTVEMEAPAASVPALARRLNEAAHQSTHPQRAQVFTSRVAASLEKFDGRLDLSADNLMGLVRLCGASEFFGEMVASNPTLISSLGTEKSRLRRRDYRAQLRAVVDPEKTFSAELSALRREWSRLLIDIGAEDATGKLHLLDSNELQTELAVASINVAYLIARREMVRRHGRLAGDPRLSVLALGRLASAGVDYGSDLDIAIVYDSLVSSPVASLTQDEAYARLVELMIAALSSVTREGYLYRVDLRLRPNGKNGPLVTSSEGFLDYVKQRSAIWEWLAYVKLRAVAGDLELGRMIETHARHAIHEKACEIDPDELKQETRRVRERLEREKGRGAARNGRRAGRGGRHDIDIKYSSGGMLDVYFATRYLQLRDDVADEGENRSTLATLARLEANGSLETRDFEALSQGYELLRSVDHHLRLIVGKVAALPATDYPAFKEIARRLDFANPTELGETLRTRMEAIREAYDRITAA
jgi:glutamate-ammonia-ligase adenylyltransferase